MRERRARRAPGPEILDYDALSRDLLRALRGRRSQVAWSRRLGAKSNIAYMWESGRRAPTAAKALNAAARAGVDVQDAVRRFYRTPPEWLERGNVTTRDGVATLLDDLRGRTPIGALAERTGRSRFAVSRWLGGDAEPRLPDFLRLLEAASLRVLDFIAVLVDPSRLPSIRNAWSDLQRARRAAYEMPWSHAVLRALELNDYRELAAHEPGFIARRIGISIDEESRCLEMLERTGQITRRGQHLEAARPLAVDTRQNPAAGRKLKAFWSRVALDRIENGDESGLFSYNLFSISEKDYQRLRELHLAYFRELRTIVASSAPAERVIVANVQLFGLDERA
ncbi:MAG TPA: DUF4423 domain-containing protein [Polyangiaceae bacterium]|jgi:transcriptional regulator with XRE-family HTH domain|nr:DUF4423 domain-containing protein [Polyangiaceae bacterium]